MNNLQTLVADYQRETLVLAEQKKKVEAVKADLLDAYATSIQSAHTEKGDFFGAVDVDGITFTTPKRVEWNQAALAKLHSEIGETASDYIKVEYSISETKYNNWPDHIRCEFENARTVKPGAITIKFKGDKE